MPPGSRPYFYIDRQGALDALAARMEDAPRVVLDVEADSLYHYYEKVCLLQVSLDGDCYIVDPLVGLDLTRLLAALAARPLVLHGTDYDLRLLRSTFGCRPAGPVFDTMVAAQLLGYEQVGLAALVERFFGVALTKSGKKSDWSRRPLSEAQLQYASDDTRYLGPLADRLRAELERLGRLGWHRESCEAAIEATAEDARRDPDREWRIKGTSRLSRRQLAFVHELWAWREGEAQRTDRPPFRVLGNRQLLELAVWAAAHPTVPLERGPRLPRSCRGRRLAALRGAVERAQRLPESQWPERPRRQQRPKPLSRAVGRRIGALRAACLRTAKELGIEPGVLAPRAAVERIAIEDARSVEDIMAAGPLLRWQAEHVARAFAEACPRQ